MSNAINPDDTSKVIARAMGQAVNEAMDPIRKRLDRIRTVSDQSAVLSEAETGLAQIEAASAREAIAAFAESANIGTTEVEVRLSEYATALRGVKGAALRARTVPDAPSDSQAYLSEGAFQEARSHASRRSFCQGESMQTALHEVTLERQEAAQPRTTPLDLSAGSDSARQRRVVLEELRETVRVNRLSRLAAVAEVAFRAIPLDAEEKGPHRDEVIRQVIELAEGGDGGGTAASEELFDAVDALVAGKPLEEALVAVAEAAADADSTLGGAVEQLGAVIENRVVAAYTRTRLDAEELQHAVNEAVERSGDDKELADARVARIYRGARPNLFESLYSANAGILREEAGGDVAPATVLMEAVGQYSAIETLSALGVLQIDDADRLAREMARIRAA